MDLWTARRIAVDRGGGGNFAQGGSGASGRGCESASASGHYGPAPVTPVPDVEAPKTPELNPPGDRRANGWAVVVAAYGARGPAEKRAQEMAKRWPKFKVNIFEPESEKARHLVVIGTNLSEDAAKALRARAISSGMPRDTYIKRFATGQQ